MAENRKVTIDWDYVDSLLEAGNDGIRVAANLGIHEDTFYRRCQKDKGIGFADYIAQKRKRGESKIIAKQYEKAMTGDNSMLIWVGKQMCGQSDQQNHTGNIIIQPINYADAPDNHFTTQVPTEGLSDSGAEGA